jgi:hypothetical protein
MLVWYRSRAPCSCPVHPGHLEPVNFQWAGLENAVFCAIDLVAFVRNVVLRISVFSVAMQRFGG